MTTTIVMLIAVLLLAHPVFDHQRPTRELIVSSVYFQSSARLDRLSALLLRTRATTPLARRLVLEPVQALDVVGEGGRKPLQCDLPAEPGIVGAIHLAHSAGADEAANLVRPEEGSRCPLHGPYYFPGERGYN